MFTNSYIIISSIPIEKTFLEKVKDFIILYKDFFYLLMSILLLCLFAYFLYKNSELKKFIKTNKQIIVLFILFPIIFLPLTLVFTSFTLDGFFSFLGGYVGVGGAVGTVWWQVTRSEKNKLKDELKSLLLSIKYHLEINLLDEDIEDKKFSSFSVLSYTSDSWIHDFSFDMIHSLEEIDMKKYHVEIFKLEYGKDIIDLNREILNFNKHYFFLQKNLSDKKNTLQNIYTNGNKECIDIIKNLSDIIYSYSNSNKENIKEKQLFFNYYLSLLKGNISKISSPNDITKKYFYQKLSEIEKINFKEKTNENLKLLSETLLIGIRLVWINNIENKNIKQEIDKLWKYYNSDNTIVSINIFKLFIKMKEITKKIQEDLEKLENL